MAAPLARSAGRTAPGRALLGKRKPKALCVLGLLFMPPQGRLVCLKL